MKNTVIGIVALISLPVVATAEPRIYAEYKNDFLIEDFDYRKDSDRNNIRVGSQWKHFYIEAGPVEYDGDFGTSYETGYKFQPTERVEIKGKLEGYKFKNEDSTSKIETELRYYFN